MVGRIEVCTSYTMPTEKLNRVKHTIRYTWARAYVGPSLRYLVTAYGLDISGPYAVHLFGFGAVATASMNLSGLYARGVHAAPTLLYRVL